VLAKQQRVPIEGIGEVTAGSNSHWLQLTLCGFSTAQTAVRHVLTTPVYLNTARKPLLLAGRRD
jgi:hypothetical protein